MATDFEWDADKDVENQRKHGVSFALAQEAFLDPQRGWHAISPIARLKRYYCFGRVEAGIITVRFTYRDKVIRIIGAGYWRKGKRIYEQENQIFERAH